LLQRYFVEPYRFVPPYRGRWLCHFVQWLLPSTVRRACRLPQMEFRGIAHLQESYRQGAGILLTPNHSRWSDPLVLAVMGVGIGKYFYYVTSYHQFKQSRLVSWVTNRLGGYSILREGTDRQAIRTSTELLAEADRAVVLFPEGTWFRMNDRVGPLQEGVGLIARHAARAGERPVVLHPVALKYWCKEDPRPALRSRLRRMEAWLSWSGQEDLDLIPRIEKLAGGLLGLKESQYLGEPQKGTLDARIAGLVEGVLGGLEAVHWGKTSDDVVLKRLRRLRQVLVKRLPEVAGDPAEVEATRRALDDLLFCENICSFSLDYLRELPSWERLTEVVLRIEETASDHVNDSVVPMGVVVEVGPALAVKDYPPARRASRAEGDPLIVELSKRLQKQLDGLVAGGPPARWGFPSAPAQPFASRQALPARMDRQAFANGVMAER
jgi:hypothetical protein